MNESKPARFIPRPLVRTNQWVIVISVVVTWITGLYWILAVPLLSGVMGMLFEYNPIIKTAALFLKKKPSEYIPEDWDQQQFNQLISVLLLFAGLISYLFSWNTAALVFTIMVGTAAFVAILGFCVGCFIRYQWQQYRYKRSVTRS